MKRVAILGAAGRDCHNFNAVFRSNPTSKVVAFTATQIPDIADLCDPAAVTGERLPPNSEELVPVVQEHTHTERADRSGKPVRSPPLQPARASQDLSCCEAPFLSVGSSWVESAVSLRQARSLNSP